MDKQELQEIITNIKNQEEQAVRNGLIALVEQLIEEPKETSLITRRQLADTLDLYVLKDNLMKHVYSKKEIDEILEHFVKQGEATTEGTEERETYKQLMCEIIDKKLFLRGYEQYMGKGYELQLFKNRRSGGGYVIRKSGWVRCDRKMDFNEETGEINLEMRNIKYNDEKEKWGRGREEIWSGKKNKYAIAFTKKQERKLPFDWNKVVSTLAFFKEVIYCKKHENEHELEIKDWNGWKISWSI